MKSEMKTWLLSAASDIMLSSVGLADTSVLLVNTRCFTPAAGATSSNMRVASTLFSHCSASVANTDAAAAWKMMSTFSHAFSQIA